MKLSYKEISQRFNIPVYTVKTMLKNDTSGILDSKYKCDEADAKVFFDKVEKRIKDSVKGKEFFTKSEIEAIFECSLQSGMARSHKTNTLVLITGENIKKQIYGDYWDGDILYYTGMGTKGDQSLEFAQNKTLLESVKNRILVVLFTKTKIGKEIKYIYRGEVKLAGNPVWEDEEDADKKMRKVCRFPLKISSKPVLVGDAAEIVREEMDAAEERYNKKLSAEELRARALKRGKKGKRGKKNTSNKAAKGGFIRDVAVKNYALERANGKCECCGEDAPFKVDGVPFLIEHHIKWLERGGDDTIYNTCGICPNCHSKIHILDLEEDTNRIIENMKADELAFSGIKI